MLTLKNNVDAFMQSVNRKNHISAKSKVSLMIDYALLEDLEEGIKRYPWHIAGGLLGFFSFQFDMLDFELFTQPHLIAIIVGLASGALLDSMIQSKQKDPLATLEKLRGRRKLYYMRPLFSVMGHIAKADGRVSEEEIKVARGIMAELQLNQDEVAMAIKAFNIGKSPEFPLANSLNDFYGRFRFNINLRDRFLRVQIQAVLAGDGVSRIVDKLLHATAAQLDIPDQRITELLKDARIHNSFTAYGRKTEKTYSERRQHSRNRYTDSHDDSFRSQQKRQENRQKQDRQREQDSIHSTRQSSHALLAEAYILLGVSVADNEKSIKRAYRRLLSQHHPDKVIGQGGGSAERELANAKTIDIRKAYELIREQRGFK